MNDEEVGGFNAPGLGTEEDLQAQYVELRKGMTAKELAFSHHYITCNSASRAARLAGLSPMVNGQEGYIMLQRPRVRKYINWFLSNYAMTAAEVLKITSDIARSDLRDYMTVKTITEPTTIEQPGADYITKLMEDIAEKEEFLEAATAAGLIRAKTYEHESIVEEVARIQKEILRVTLRLKRDPNYTVTIQGPPRTIEVADIDLVKLMRNPGAGKIKSLEHTRYGVKVETYALDGALKELARMYGMYKKDNEQMKDAPAQITVITAPPPPDEDEIPD